MSIVAEACISVAVEGAICALLGLCHSGTVSSSRRRKGLDEIRKWPELLKQLQLVLHDAGSKQIRDPMVQTWLLELEHLVYDAEDILEEFNYHAHIRQHQRKRDKLIDFVSHPISSIQSSSAITSQLKAITTKLFQLMEQKQKLDLLGTDYSAVAHRPTRPYCGCITGDEVVYGRDLEKDDIVKLLLHEDAKETVGVFPIVGMGGMGKTTLARYVFNDDKVVRHFEIRIWVCVSTDYDIPRITKSILEAALSRACEFTELPMVQSKLHEALEGKRFLLVLDDVWNKSYQDWNTLRTPLTSGRNGSKVIVTTRLGEVAEAMGTATYKPLSKLNEDDCWRLFCRHANRCEDEGLTVKRQHISDKCNGLPLLAMALGGLLRYKRGEDWEDVLREECEDAEERTRSVLRISYYELPPDLKRCFVFCATFPAAYEFKENDLVLKWLGLGLVSWEGTREVDDEDEEGAERKGLGHKYFRDLVSRSLFLPSRSNSYRYVMHDLVRDVALQFSAMACCAREKGACEKSQWFRTRHLSFHSESLNTIAKEIKAEAAFLPLRSFLHLNGCLNWNEQGKNLDLILQHLRHLRLLSLHKSLDAEFPGSIGALPHLRYLDLSKNRKEPTTGSTRTLLKSIGVLYRLEILILRECLVLSELPKNIGNLHLLKYLNASFTNIKTLPISIATLRSLEYLILDNCKYLEDIPSEIGKLQKLRQLNIAFTNVKDLPSMITNVSTLESLIVRGCQGLIRLPDGIGTLTKLRHLDIGGTEFVKRGVPPEGVTGLKSLRFLSDYVVGGQDQANLAKLGELECLRGELKISRLENVRGSTDAEGAKLWGKELDSLTLEWSTRVGLITPQNARIEEEVLEKLRPNSRIKKLTLIGYSGARVPSWFGNINLEKLVLERLRNDLHPALLNILKRPEILGNI